MALEKLVITRRSPYEDGRSFGRTGAYERIDGIAHYAVDPLDPANARINDLDLVERDSDGLVRYHGDITILKPTDESRGNRRMVLHLPNRGRFFITHINFIDGVIKEDASLPSGDGFMMNEGWTMVWVGWQWDVPRRRERTRIGLAAPNVPLVKRDPEERVQLRLLLDRATPYVPLTDQHVGSIGHHEPIPPLDRDDPTAYLTVRDTIYGAAQKIPFDDWKFAKVESGNVVADDHHIWLSGGFEAGRIYDFIYRPHDCPVVGTGMLALRDTALWMRHNPASPVSQIVDHVIGEGISQCGRMWRHYLSLGLNRGECGRPAVDGILSHIAGGRIGEFNNRHGQPSVQPTPSTGHLFPFSDDPQTDPNSNRKAGLFDLQREIGCMPKVMYTDTSAEYWRGDAALTHTKLEDCCDLDLPSDVRRYLYTGTQHSNGIATLEQEVSHGGKGGNCVNYINYRPLYRASIMNLLKWVADDVPPPDSMVPRDDDETRVSRSVALELLKKIPDIALPDPASLTCTVPLDLGPNVDTGRLDLPAKVTGPPYPDFVSAVDKDGNETAGISMPDISVPIATHTGFNPRHPDTGGKHLMLEYFGSTLPFPRTPEERAQRGDPRAAIFERYRDQEDYLVQVREAAKALVSRRLLLEQDIELCVKIAERRFKCVVEGSAI